MKTCGDRCIECCNHCKWYTGTPNKICFHPSHGFMERHDPDWGCDDFHCRLRADKELASLAAAVESSGVVCPDCHGTKRDPFAVKPCPRCSVEMMEHEECERCIGRGNVAADNPADHAMFDPDGTDYAVYARAGGRTPCPDCKGLGHRPGQIREVALGKVYPRKDDPK